MNIIHDKRLPAEAVSSLCQYGNCLPFYTEHITDESIAGHPDVFICQLKDKLIIAPNTPPPFVASLQSAGFTLEKGSTLVGKEKYNSICYNVVITDKYIIHNQKFTDRTILENTKNQKFIHINQGFARCSLLPLKDDSFLTSDKGIEKELSKHNLNCYYISPKEILLPGVQYGFIGGCMGIYQNTVFIIGNLDYHSQGKNLRTFLQSLHYEIVELYNGELFDGGGLILG